MIVHQNDRSGCLFFATYYIGTLNKIGNLGLTKIKKKACGNNFRKLEKGCQVSALNERRWSTRSVKNGIAMLMRFQSNIRKVF